MANDRCYICALPLVEKTYELKGAEDITHRVTCLRCGIYDITHYCTAVTQKGSTLSSSARQRLSYAIRKATDAHGRFGDVLDRDIDHLVERIQVPRPLEQVDNLLAYAAANTTLGTRTEAEHVETWGARLGLIDTTQQLGFIKEHLRGLVEFAEGSNAIAVRLTPAGWHRAEEIRLRHGTGNQAFVAMWFHAGMDRIFDDGFAQALRGTGHVPYRVDRGAHNNKIDDEIVAQIRRSKIVVVDTTGTRPSVYFEAGFAMGLGIPVVWCCNSSWRAYTLDGVVAPDNATPPTPAANAWSQQAAFDTRQHPHIFWNEPVDLCERLTARIRALGFDAAWNSKS